MRYVMQEWEIPVELPTSMVDAAALDQLRRRFLDAHRARYGFAREDMPIELVALSVKAVIPAPPVVYGASRTKSSATSSPTRVQRLIVDPTSSVDAPVYERDSLSAGWALEGPLLVTESTSTVYVHPGWGIRADESGTLIARRR